MLDDTTRPTAKGAAAEGQRRPAPALPTERVLEVTHFTDKLFSFKTTRRPGYRFESGQFTMIGLVVDGRPLLRAYSITSAIYDDWLEFFSIIVPGGPLTSRLKDIRPGDEILVGSKPTGTLLNGNLRPGKRLLLLGTGTGFAPFASLLRDPDTYERYESIVAVEGCRQVAELAFADRVTAELRDHELLGELAREKLHYYSTVTREDFPRRGRIPDLVTSGKLFGDLAMPPLDRENDRVMICGNPAMLSEMTERLTALGFVEGSSGAPGDFVIEKAFAQR